MRTWRDCAAWAKAAVAVSSASANDIDFLAALPKDSARSLRSSTLSTSVNSRLPAASICSRRCWRSAAVARAFSDCNNWVNPSTAFSGVRSSWLMRANKADLLRLSRSASSRSRCTRSIWRISVTSQLTPMRRVTRPCASVKAIEREASVRTAPSLARRMRNS